jgi:hypothetical protein
MLNFLESKICLSRQNCVSCRREEAFRKQLESEFEVWECPLGIEINAPDDKFPKEVLDKYNKIKETMEENKKKYALATKAFEELEISLSGENLIQLELIRTAFFPNSKTAEKCKYVGIEIGKVDQKCCGGTIKKVSAFDCSKQVVCTDKKCKICQMFERKL